MLIEFLKKLFGNKLPVKRHLDDASSRVSEDKPTTDTRKAECPYCKGALKKIPGAKTKCPHCGQFVYVRTSPSDNARKVVTKAEADRIEEEWSIANGTHEQYLAEKQRTSDERQRLADKFGEEPSEHDVQWGLLNKDLLSHAKRGDWGLYRNDRFVMSEMLRKEQKLTEVLWTYLEVCYLDLNGAHNVGGLADSELLAEFPPFNPKLAFLAPGIIEKMQRIIKKLSLSREAVQAIFCEHCAKATRGIPIPRTTDERWQDLEKEIWN